MLNQRRRATGPMSAGVSRPRTLEPKRRRVQNDAREVTMTSSRKRIGAILLATAMAVATPLAAHAARGGGGGGGGGQGGGGGGTLRRRWRRTLRRRRRHALRWRRWWSSHRRHAFRRRWWSSIGGMHIGGGRSLNIGGLRLGGHGLNVGGLHIGGLRLGGLSHHAFQSGPRAFHSGHSLMAAHALSSAHANALTGQAVSAAAGHQALANQTLRHQGLGQQGLGRQGLRARQGFAHRRWPTAPWAPVLGNRFGGGWVGPLF